MLIKYQTHVFRNLIRLSIVLILPLLCCCEKKISVIPKSELMNLPQLTVKHDETVYNDSGRVQLILKTPIMEEYDNNDSPYYEFRQGINVQFYEGHKAPVGTVTSKYAKYTKKTNLWELKDSVIVVNESGDKLETEVLYWDERKNLIYSDRFVKITNPDQIVTGTGFESDPKLKKRKISKVNATIYLKDEQ
jgi:LPS export ABC transporter protein LptC